VASGRERRGVATGERLLHLAEDVIYVGVAGLLSVGAIALLISAGSQLVDLRESPTDEVLLSLLDTLLLVFIFVELLSAVRVTITERTIVAEPFLVVGIIASIKEIVVLSVKAAEDEFISKGPEFARAVTEIGVLGGLTVGLALASVLLRRKEREPEEGESTSTQPAGARQPESQS